MTYTMPLIRVQVITLTTAALHAILTNHLKMAKLAASTLHQLAIASFLLILLLQTMY